VGTYFEVGKYCYVASARRRTRRYGAHGGGEGRGHIVSPRAQLVESVSFHVIMHGVRTAVVLSVGYSYDRTSIRVQHDFKAAHDVIL